MATKAEGIRIGTAARWQLRRAGVARRFLRALKRWGQRGQLTGYSNIELSRYTGGRI